MHDAAARTGIWFVYDGDCPLCSMAAYALKIRKEYGALNLLDARTHSAHPLIVEINQRGLDLDEGMVIWADGAFFHGHTALMLMSRYGDTGWFNRINRSLFQSERIARMLYPMLRGLRNLLVRVRGAGKINNLGRLDEPIFKSVFGNSWFELPAVMRRHYANRAYTDDIVRVDGTLTVEAPGLGRFLKPIFHLTGALVPYEGENVPVTVNFIAESGSNALRFDRTFSFPGMRPYKFLSRMIPVAGNEIVELMGPGLGWRCAFSWTGEKVVLAHRGYVVSLFGYFLPIPLTLVFGAGSAEERPIDDDSFSMMTEVRHPLWGRVFGYSGTFKITKDA